MSNLLYNCNFVLSLVMKNRHSKKTNTGRQTTFAVKYTGFIERRSQKMPKEDRAIRKIGLIDWWWVVCSDPPPAQPGNPLWSSSAPSQLAPCQPLRVEGRGGGKRLPAFVFLIFPNHISLISATDHNSKNRDKAAYSALQFHTDRAVNHYTIGQEGR